MRVRVLSLMSPYPEGRLHDARGRRQHAGKTHRMGPGSSWPRALAENPYERPERGADVRANPVRFFGAQPHEFKREDALVFPSVRPPSRHSNRQCDENCTGLAQIAILGPNTFTEKSIRALKLAHDFGQPCTIFVCPVLGCCAGAMCRRNGLNAPPWPQYKYHSVAQITGGVRRVLVLEYWQGDENCCNHRCELVRPARLDEDLLPFCLPHSCLYGESL
jgi:hypothetical protein